VTHLDDEHFEGLGSVVGEVAGALGEAMHSNRTLVWGVGLPYMLDRTRDEWVSPRGSEGAGSVWFSSTNNTHLDCSGWEGMGGGAWACFFASISSCSLEDATFDELVALGENPYNNSARLKFQEHRRGVSLYTVPSEAAAPDLRAAALAAAHPRHTMAAGLIGYLLRLVPRVADAVEARRAALWGGRIGVSCPPRGFPGSTAGNSSEDTSRVWGMHVRRGDVARNEDVYKNRQLFSFENMYEALRKKAHAVAKQGGATPVAVYVASDGGASEWIQDLCKRAPTLAPQWPGGALPRFFAMSPKSRYITPYGSHTAAADGGCQKDCALQAEDVLALRAAAATSPSSPARMMRVLAEAAEDIVMLSKSDVLVAQASSFFSTTTMMLAWANRAGGAAPNATILPDSEGVANGAVQTGLLSAGLNGTAAIPRARGHERWIAVSKRFLGSLAPEETAGCGGHTHGYLFGCDDATRRMRLEEHLPLVPPKAFEREAQRWLGDPKFSRIWDGECPLSDRPKPGATAEELTQFAAASFVHGEGHRDIAHQGQALACWADSAATLRKVLRSGEWVYMEAGVTTDFLSRVETRIQEYRDLQIRKYTTRDGISRGLSHAVRPRALPPLPALPSDADSGSAASLPADAIYEPIHLECACDAEPDSENPSLLVVGWEGTPSSYAAVTEGLLIGFAEAAAAGGDGVEAAMTVDFLAAPAYKKAWEKLHVEGAVAGVSAGGLRSRMAVYRLESPDQDHLVPPALYGVSIARHEHVSKMGGPLPPPSRRRKKRRSVSLARSAQQQSDLPRCPDVILRVHYPLDVAPSACARTRVFVFGTAEADAATDVQSFQQKSATIGRDFWASMSPVVTMITPSKWSAARITDSGAPKDRVVVLPHGFDPHRFRPASAVEKATLRARYGLTDRCTVGITVGHMRWKKGADVLLKAALETASSFRGKECLRLIFKGVDALYSTSKAVEALLDARGNVENRETARELLETGRLILDVRGENTPHAEVADLIRASDFAVSSYRAEGFNLPVLEAAACGLPIVATAGGATDDFLDASFTRRVKSSVLSGGAEGTLPASRHVEPDPADLRKALHMATCDDEWRARAGPAAAKWVFAQNLTWEHVARQHARLFFRDWQGAVLADAPSRAGTDPDL
jgi:glycosyltransferase involved in cell wall biosynthesis